MQRTFPAAEPVELYVELGSGRLQVETADTDTVEIEVTGPHAEEFTVDQSGRGVRVLAPRARSFGMLGKNGHDVVVTMPHDSDLVTKLGSADLTATGQLDRVDLRGGSGEIEVDLVSGSAHVESGSGDVRLDEVRGELRIKSGSGDVQLGEIAAEGVVSSGSGDVIVGSSLASLTVKTGSGDLVVRRATGQVGLTSGSGDLLVQHMTAGKLALRTASGDLHVGVPKGTPVWTDVNSVSGRVTSRIESAGQPADGQDYVELRATTVSGDVLLEQA